jgi:hypothetical protein
LIDPDQFTVGKVLAKVGKQLFSAFAILNVSSMNEETQQETISVEQLRALASLATGSLSVEECIDNLAQIKLERPIVPCGCMINSKCAHSASVRSVS